MKSSKKNSNDHSVLPEFKSSSFKFSDDRYREVSELISGEVKVMENLKIKINDAKKLGLGNKDFRYCYCSVQLDSEEVYKTRIIEKSLSPFFQEEFVFDIPSTFNFLSFHMHELQEDILSKRDLIFAKVILQKPGLIDYNGIEKWYPLQPANNRNDVQGQLLVEIKFDKCDSLSQGGFNDDSHKLTVRIPKCSNLGGVSCDPYLAVTLQGVHRSDTKKSKVKKGNANPSFNEEFIFELNKTNSLRRSWFDLSLGGSSDGKTLEEKWNLQILRIAVYNSGTLGDQFLGEVKIPLNNISQPYSQWHLLKSRSDKSNTLGASKEDLGLLRIKITYTKEIIFPPKTYNHLLNNLLVSSAKIDLSASWPALIGAICGTKKQSLVAQHLVQIFLHQGKLRSLIHPLADFEILYAKNVQAIFRNSSFATFIIEEVLRVVGRSYLHKVLTSEVEHISEDAHSCEIDPARLKLTNGLSTSKASEGTPTTSADLLHNNRENLWIYVESVLNSITESAPDCPELFCGIFHDLRCSAVKHYPDDLNVRYRVVTNFFFLRFFSAALLCPRKYKIISKELSGTASRTLTLVSKSIQQICNLSLPKQSTRNPVDNFLKGFFDKYVTNKHLEKVKNFIDVVSSFPGTIRGQCDEYVERVTLKEGEMIKRAQGRAFLLGRKNFKTRYFLLTNHDLSYGKEKQGKPLCVIPVNQIKGVEKLQEESFRMSNMFQVIQSNRILYCKANNSVEQKEWMDVLTKVCSGNIDRVQHYHPAAYIQGKYACCTANVVKAPGCTPVSRLPTLVRPNLDQDRNLERLYVILSGSQEHIRSLQEECGARSVYVGPDPNPDDNVDSETENTDDGENVILQDRKPLPLPLDSLDPQQTYRTLCSILECIQILDRIHTHYHDNVTNDGEERETKSRPQGGS